MDRLIEGYRRFRAGAWRNYRDIYEELARQGQRPRTLVIACSDSRVDPQMVFDAPPGDMFVVRNVAALVPPYAPDSQYHGTSAALEFAVRGLEVERIVVMGHGRCGGVQVLLSDKSDPTGDFVGNWMEIARPAREATAHGHPTPEDRVLACEHETVRVSLRNLETFPWIMQRVADGRLSLNGCFFDVFTGRLVLIGKDGTSTVV